MSAGEILNVVHVINVGEIQQAQIALARSRDQSVQRIAQVIIQDHTALENRIAELAQISGVSLQDPYSAPGSRCRQPRSRRSFPERPRRIRSRVPPLSGRTACRLGRSGPFGVATERAGSAPEGIPDGVGSSARTAPGNGAARLTEGGPDLRPSIRRDVPEGAWSWEICSPAEIACRSTVFCSSMKRRSTGRRRLRYRLEKPFILRSAYRSPEYTEPLAARSARTARSRWRARHSTSRCRITTRQPPRRRRARPGSSASAFIRARGSCTSTSGRSGTEASGSRRGRPASPSRRRRRANGSPRAGQ